MAEIQKLYNISLIGEKQVAEKMLEVNRSFDQAKKTFLDLKATFAKGGLSVDEMKQLKVQIEAARLETIKLNQERIKLTNDGRALSNSLKQERIDRIATNRTLSQSTNEYKEMATRLNILRNEAKNLGATLGIESDEFIDAARKANILDKEIKAIDAAVGQFQRNVGNYPKEINIGSLSKETINSLKNAGLGDALAAQLEKARSKADVLDEEFREMQRNIVAVRNAGVEGFEAIEREMIQNRLEAGKMRNEIKDSSIALNGFGDVGTNIMGNFNRSLSQAVLGYVGLQAVMSGIQSTIGRLKDDAVSFDSVDAAIKAISGSEAGYAKNQEYLIRLSDQYGQNLLALSQGYKNFYASSTLAGISQNETREIFEDVIDAASVLKLKQDDVNGVLIAFSQIASKGKVQAEELRGQIGERLPGAFSIAAKAMNVTEKELNKMMEKGELASDVFLPKFAAELQKTFTNGGKEVTGLAAQFGRMDNLLNKISSNKNFIRFISLVISGLMLTASTVMAIPWGVWIGFVSLLTVAYLQNVLAVWANVAAVSAKVVVQARLLIQMAIGNALIITATALELAQAVVTGILTAAKWLLVAALNAVGISTAGLRAAYILLNSTFMALPLGWILAGLLLIGAATSAYGQKADDTTKKIKAKGEAILKTAAQMRVAAEIEKKVTEVTADRIAKLQVLTKIASDLNNSDQVRKKTLEELIKIDSRYGEAMDGNIVRTEKLKEITDELTKSIKEQARAEAAKNLLTEKQAEILKNEFKIAELRVRAEKQQKEGFFKISGRDRGLFEEAAADQIDDLKKQNLTLQQDVDALAQRVATNLENEIKEETVVDDTKAGTIKDYLRDINALRQAELSELKKSKLQGLITEEEFLVRSLAVNIKYNNKILNHFKDTTAETRKLRADTAADSIEQEIETNEKLFKIREEAFKQQLENDRARSQNDLENVTSDPSSTPLQKEEAEQVFYQETLAQQIAFNQAMDKLEKDYALQSKKNAGDRANILLKIQQDLNRNTFELSQAQYDSILKGITDFATYRRNNAEIEASIKRVQVLNDKSLSQAEKEREIERINAALKLSSINTELGALDAEIKLNEERFKNQRRTNEELAAYNQLLRDRQLLLEGKALAENEIVIQGKIEFSVPSINSTQDAIKEKILKAFSLDEGEYGALLGNVIGSAFDTAQLAMESYFDSERQNIEASKQRTFEKIDLEKQQLLNQAQSQAERDTIERQSRIKKEEAEKEAGRRLKKVKKAEASIALATELANIAVSAAANPANAVTFGAAGIAMYSILAGLALTRYAMTVSNINKQQFGRGGSIPSRGGQFSGPSHDNGGIPYGDKEFEGDELAIINKRSARSNRRYTVSGTPKQIASAINEIGGGVSFASGAIFKRYAKGGYIGSSVQPPVFTSYYTRTNLDVNNSRESDRISSLESTIIRLAEIVKTEAKKPVVLNPNHVTESQRKQQIQTDIATL